MISQVHICFGFLVNFHFNDQIKPIIAIKFGNILFIWVAPSSFSHSQYFYNQSHAHRWIIWSQERKGIAWFCHKKGDRTRVGKGWWLLDRWWIRFCFLFLICYVDSVVCVVEICFFYIHHHLHRLVVGMCSRFGFLIGYIVFCFHVMIFT